MSQNSELVDDFEQFYRKYKHEDILELAGKYPNEQQSLVIDWRNELTPFDPDLADDYIAEPEQIRRYAEEALRLYDVAADVTLGNASVRLENVGYDTHARNVGEYGESDLGELVPIRGQVSKITKKQITLDEAAFECQLCGTLTRIPQNDANNLQEPHECQGCERQGPFKVNMKQSELIDHQVLRLKLPPEKQGDSNGEEIDISLEDDLVNTTTPGDRVEIATELDMIQTDQEKAIFDFRGDADSVMIQETDFEDIETDEYEDQILEIAANNPYEQIVGSIAPSIHGHDTVKLAVGLQMFGGTRKQLPDGSVERGDSHMLLIGDPGVGKSVILNYAHEMAPRSVYTDGKGSTTAGLTASAVRDDFGGGQWSIEGGSLVKAHKGLACVDELDDMDADDRAALNTALEKQEIPVSKAGITTTLPARTTLLAAANPEHGRFDPYAPISEQIDLDPTLISRFDLIFTLKDQNDEQLDRDIVSHKLRTAEAGQKIAAGERLDDSLKEEVDPEIDAEVMRAYVAYAKQNITPVFTDAAKSYLQDEFVKLRQINQSEDEDPDRDGRPIPVTFRKQEAITRLSESSARIRLSEEITKDDVDRALRLVRQSLEDVEMDPDTGDYDADIVETGQPKSQRNRIQYVTRMIDELEEDTPKGCPYDELIDVAAGGKYTQSEIDRAIDTLKDKGELYEPATDHLRLS